MGKIKECFVLKQTKVNIPDVKRGDLFRVCYEEDGKEQYSDWQVALHDAKVDGDSTDLKAERVYFVMGRPEIIDVALRKSEIALTSESPKPVENKGNSQ